jgi:hypothetical protein
MSNDFKGGHIFEVWCGDTTGYFQMGRQYRWGYLKQIFKERLERCPACSHPYELFPGGVFTDASGKKWKIQLQAVMVPAEPEEEHVHHE